MILTRASIFNSFSRIAEQDADSRKLVPSFHMAVELVHVHLNLAEVLMGQRVGVVDGQQGHVVGPAEGELLKQRGGCRLQ